MAASLRFASAHHCVQALRWLAQVRQHKPGIDQIIPGCLLTQGSICLAEFNVDQLCGFSILFSQGENLSIRVGANDLAEARRLNDRIYPLARVFYAEPWADMHNRMKEALVLLGRLPRAVVRPPLVKLGRAEIERIRAALVESGLLDAKASRDAA